VVFSVTALTSNGRAGPAAVVVPLCCGEPEPVEHAVTVKPPARAPIPRVALGGCSVGPAFAPHLDAVPADDHQLFPITGAAWPIAAHKFGVGNGYWSDFCAGCAEPMSRSRGSGGFGVSGIGGHGRGGLA
jgi:hypothetical protein